MLSNSQQLTPAGVAFSRFSLEFTLKWKLSRTVQYFVLPGFDTLQRALSADLGCTGKQIELKHLLFNTQA